MPTIHATQDTTIIVIPIISRHLPCYCNTCTCRHLPYVSLASNIMMASQIIALLFLCSLVIGQESPNLSIYGDVPGLTPSPYYSFRVREQGSGEWIDTFALVTECTLEKYCNTTGFYDEMRDWSNTYINFEMKDGIDIEIEITKLFEGSIEKAVVHPKKAAEQCSVQDGKAIVKIRNTGLFTVDINGQMDDQDTGRTPEGPFYEGPPIHTLTIFANPFVQGRPSVEDDDVRTVAPGEEAPSEGDWSTLYFLPGLHDIGLNFPLHKESINQFWLFTISTDYNSQ